MCLYTDTHSHRAKSMYAYQQEERLTCTLTLLLAEGGKRRLPSYRKAPTANPGRTGKGKGKRKMNQVKPAMNQESRKFPY